MPWASISRTRSGTPGGRWGKRALCGPPNAIFALPQLSNRSASSLLRTRTPEHHRVFGRIHIQADDVAHLVDQQRIARQLECLAPMRLQVEGAPDLLNRRAAQPAGLGHAPATPVGGAPRQVFQGPHDYLLTLLIADPALCPAAPASKTTIDQY